MQSVRFNHQRTNYSKKDQYWIPEKETRPYIPNPQRCFQCQKFGHTKNSCKGKAVCAGCGEEGHNLDDCQNEPKCVNCQGDHVAISRDCLKWKIEKDIMTLKYTEKISFADARKRLQPSFDPSKDLYATVTQTPPQSSRPLPPWAPPKVLLLCRSWGACVPRRSQRLCQLEFWLLVGTTTLDRLWARGQTKCNTLLMLATSVFGWILLTTLLCDVLVEVQAGHLMAQWRGMHGSCLVPFVMLTPTILRGRVPSWLRWWLGV